MISRGAKLLEEEDRDAANGEVRCGESAKLNDFTVDFECEELEERDDADELDVDVNVEQNDESFKSLSGEEASENADDPDMEQETPRRSTRATRDIPPQKYKLGALMATNFADI
nr:uncharacterized protein LOC115257585 [Aedes albopictus]